MSEIVFKRSMNIGTISAESDQEFLENCFIETPEYEEICDFNNQKMILLGRTGSGKTALLNKIKDKVDKCIEIRPDTFALQYITNVPFVSKLVDEGINLDIFYKFLWLHEILSQIIKNNFSYNNKNMLDALTEKVSDLGRVAQLKKYMNEFEGIFFSEGSTEKITKDIEKQISCMLGTDVTSLQGKLSSNIKKEIETKTSQYINNKQIKQLKNIITLFKEYFGHNKQKKIVVFIDNLDENWINDESKYKLIDALLNAVRLFVDIPNIKILLAMRSDLLVKTCEITKRQNEKDESFTLRLNWTSKMLKELLDKRIQYLFQHKYKRRSSISFADIFNCQVNNLQASDYIISRTMMRPRDAINFVNLCINEADNESNLKENNIINAEKIFKRERFKALAHEWFNIYGNVETYFKIINKLGNIFTYSNLLAPETFSEIEIISYENNYLAEKLMNRKNNDINSKETFIKDFLNILFTIGFIGIRDKESNIIDFATPYRATLSELDFVDNLLFEVHPLFAK
ncbi:MAG: P-loop NTPase fold protein [Candidatus Gastranaerophilales bacterium]